MEMLERCPGCSVAREAEGEQAKSDAGAAGSRSARPCAHCGYDGPFPPSEGDARPLSRESLPSFAGARAKLATATQDLFRLSGNYSIPVEAPAPEPPAPSAPEPPVSSGARKPEQSLMFSLEALMKATQAPPQQAANDEVASDLWSMQSAEPLFGTAHDQALLTTPLKLEPAQSMDSMTLPSGAPSGRRLWPLVVAAGAGLALAGLGLWFYGSFGGEAAARAASPTSEHAALAAQLPEPAEPAPAEPTPGATLSATAPVPSAGSEAESPPPGAEPPVGTAEEAGGDTESVKAADDDEAEAGEAEEDEAEAKQGSASSAREKPRRARRRAASRAPRSTRAEFDKRAAISALNAASAKASGCGAGGAPGKGKVQITFAPSGRVTGAELVGQFAGTAAGECALRHFRAARVPAFSGSSVTVAKSFRID